MDMDLRSGAREHFAEARESDDASRSTGRVEPLRPRAVEPARFGSSWYHEDAIEQENSRRIEARCNPYF